MESKNYAIQVLRKQLKGKFKIILLKLFIEIQ